jgi:hypothetical protein
MTLRIYTNLKGMDVINYTNSGDHHSDPGITYLGFVAECARQVYCNRSQ